MLIMLFSSTRSDWLGNIRSDILAGLVVALARIPEAIAFSIIAGVDPKIGHYPLHPALNAKLDSSYWEGRPTRPLGSNQALCGESVAETANDKCPLFQCSCYD